MKKERKQALRHNRKGTYANAGASAYFGKLYLTEIFHYHVLKRLAEVENDHSVKPILEELARQEVKHSKIWGNIPGAKKVAQEYKRNYLPISFIVLIRRIFGLEFAIKVMEHGEQRMEGILYNGTGQSFTGSQRRAIAKVRESEAKVEDNLKEKLLLYSSILSNIRSVILGMNDGLVEILGAVAGFAVVFNTPLLVFVAGSITAIAGTLSMAGGSYLSIEYEKSVYKSRNEYSSKDAAFYTGIAYILGSLFPLLPFMLGFGGYGAILLSIIITALVLVIASTIISIVSDTSITKRIIRTLIISLGIVAITITLGIIARNVFHISV
ncbi:MAG: VIT1/CCC1 transporter family protein [Candidatus Micrarchaeaceae archaeon]